MVSKGVFNIRGMGLDNSKTPMLSMLSVGGSVAQQNVKPDHVPQDTADS